MRANVARLREGHGLTYRDLSERLTEHGRPVPPLGLSRIEKGTRRVDADDLVALAVVLGVHPAALLLPFTASGNVEITGYGMVSAYRAWTWMEGQRPLVVPEDDDGTAHVQFQAHTHPKGMRTYFLETPRGYEQFKQESGSDPAVELAHTDYVPPERGDDGGT